MGLGACRNQVLRTFYHSVLKIMDDRQRTAYERSEGFFCQLQSIRTEKGSSTQVSLTRCRLQEDLAEQVVQEDAADLQQVSFF